MKHLNISAQLLKTNLKVRYRKTWIGFFWVILNPILIYFVQSTLYTHVLKNMTAHYYFYLLTGIMPWFFLTQNVDMSANAIRTNSSLIKNLSIPPFLIVLCLTLENFINYFVSISLIFFILLFITDISFLQILSVYCVSLLFIFFVLSLSYLAAILNTLFKDIKYIAHFLFTLLYFLTPTFYYVNYVPDNFKKYIYLNPFYWIINAFRISQQNNQEVRVSLSIFILIVIFSICAAFFIHKRLKNLVAIKL